MRSYPELAMQITTLNLSLDLLVFLVPSGPGFKISPCIYSNFLRKVSYW